MGTIRIVFEEWLAGKNGLLPTWAEMMVVLREVGMNVILLPTLRSILQKMVCPLRNITFDIATGYIKHA